MKISVSVLLLAIVLPGVAGCATQGRLEERRFWEERLSPRPWTICGKVPEKAPELRSKTGQVCLSATVGLRREADDVLVSVDGIRFLPSPP